MNIETIYTILSKIHNEIENEILEKIYLNIPLSELRKFIENAIKYKFTQFLEKNTYLTYGIAFPVGLNINHCVAHYSPLDNIESPIFSKNDVLKIDYGIHINGYILDSAFTVCFLEEYKELLETSRKACMEAAKICKKGMAISEISKKIQSCIPKKFGTIRDLCGHQIKPYKIHAGKFIPNVIFPVSSKIESGEIYSIEPFITTNKNPNTYEDTNKEFYSHYMFNYFEKDIDKTTVINVLPTLKKYGTLAFHKDWIPGEEQKYLDMFVSKGIYKWYPPIYQVNINSKVAQFETTIVVTENQSILCKSFDSIDKYILTNKL